MKRVLLFGAFTNYFAQFVIILCNYGANVYLARALGPDQYGIYTIIFTILNLLSLVSITGIYTATSKYVASMPGQAMAVRNSAIRLNGLIAVLFGAVFVAFTGPLSGLFKDRSLAPYLYMITPAIIPFFIYPVFLGYFNGLKRYRDQAVVKIYFAVANSILSVGLVYIGFKIYGAIAGFALGAVIACIAGYFMAGRARASRSFSMKTLLVFAIPFTVLSFTFVGTRSISVLLIKSVLGRNDLAAYYNVALRICIVPHDIAMAIAGALFPLVAQSFSLRDKDGLIKHVLKSLKYLVIFLIPVSASIVLFRDEIVAMLFGQAYASAAEPMMYIAFAELFIGLEFIFLLVLSGIDRHADAMLISILIFALSIIFNLILIPRFSISGAAIATLVSYAIGAVLSGAAVFRHCRRLQGRC